MVLFSSCSKEQLKKSTIKEKSLDLQVIEAYEGGLEALEAGDVLYAAKKFNEALGVTGLIITKLDGSAKGGIILSIANELKIPIRYIGIGEKTSDMQKFDRYQYVDALLNYNDS